MDATTDAVAEVVDRVSLRPTVEEQPYPQILSSLSNYHHCLRAHF